MQNALPGYGRYLLLMIYAYMTYIVTTTLRQRWCYFCSDSISSTRAIGAARRRASQNCVM